MGRAIVAGGKPAMEAPSGGITLADIAVGSLVKINENGSPVEFYVAKHDYESGLNGAGRTLLVRKDCYDTRKWNTTSRVNKYASCSIDTWFNGDYKGLLDGPVQEAIGTTQFYYTPGGSDYTVTTLARGIFALSLTELGLTDSYAKFEGSALPIADRIKIACLNGSAIAQWTRSPVSGQNQALYVYMASNNGIVTWKSCSEWSNGSRPCFTLPTTSQFDEETLEFKGVA